MYMSFIPASTSSMTASFTEAGGTYTIPVFISGCFSRASLTVLYTGFPATSEPPLPGVTPATINPGYRASDSATT